MLSNSEIELRPITRLLVDTGGNPVCYWIPAYQRGYRWTRLQVTQLLGDIWEFVQTDEGDKNRFYCLQPLVVKPHADGSFEVVDGQQRLTTIFILLSYLKDMTKILGKMRFEIRFKTRDAEEFLQNIDIDRAEENIDFYHICEAWYAIDTWVKAHDSSHALKLLQHLLNDDEAGRNVKVIWYELDPQDDPVSAFTRLNVGKIPLTNDELVRAIFLRRAASDDSSGNLSLRIAYEWDHFEKILQGDAFWYFLSNADAPDHNRIGLLFELAAKDISSTFQQDVYGIFHHFSDRLSEISSAEREWRAVKNVFMALEEWFEDRELFHVVGFLVQQGTSLTELLKASTALSKRDFAFELRRQAFRLTIGGELQGISKEEIKEYVSERCAEVTYKDHAKAVRQLLLLFNLATLLDDPRSNLRFQFDSFKRETWDIEHIRSVSDERPGNHTDRIKWLTHCQGYLSHIDKKDARSLVKKINAFLNLKQVEADSECFELVDEKILKYFGESHDGEQHGISNLTLLDSRTNRSYRNAVFAIKRKILLEHDKSGVFVPLCTRNVFLKCYSPTVDNVMFWGPDDSKRYEKQIVETLTRFFLIDKATVA